MAAGELGDLLDDVDRLTAAIGRGDVSAVEVVTESLRRLRAVDETTNCVAAWNDEDALARAARLDRERRRNLDLRPLHGVPLTVKDWIDVAELPCTGGYMECRSRVPRADATVVARMREQGAIVIAKTAVQVETELFGPVFNPHDPTRSPGGSSSGEGAAVGGAGSLLGLASDSGGSIRLPAAWCGASALKPSAGRVPTTGHFPRVGDRSDGRTQIGPMATNVAGLVTALRVIAGPDGRDAGIPPIALGDPAAVRVNDLRVGFSMGDATWTTTAAVTDAVKQSLTMLEEIGAAVTGSVDHHFDESLDITRRYWKRASGRSDNGEIEGQLRDWDKYRTRMLDEYRDVDVVIMPATESVAPVHRPVTELDYIFMLPASLTGAPVVVLPVSEDEGLPVAVQIVARPWHDDVSLRVAQALELGRRE